MKELVWGESTLHHIFTVVLAYVIAFNRHCSNVQLVGDISVFMIRPAYLICLQFSSHITCVLFKNHVMNIEELIRKYILKLICTHVHLDHHMSSLQDL